MSLARRRCRASDIYKHKRDIFAKILHEQLGSHAEFNTPQGGLAFWLKFPADINVHELSDMLLTRGVKLTPPDQFSLNTHGYGLRLGYASLKEKELERGITTLEQTLRELKRLRP